VESGTLRNPFLEEKGPHTSGPETSTMDPSLRRLPEGTSLDHNWSALPTKLRNPHWLWLAVQTQPEVYNMATFRIRRNLAKSQLRKRPPTRYRPCYQVNCLVGCMWRAELFVPLTQLPKGPHTRGQTRSLLIFTFEGWFLGSQYKRSSTELRNPH
jgi:hypothetical protein